ncbi:MAG: Signal peptidase I, partial [uncultured Rubrobacteraceae bacterium]
ERERPRRPAEGLSEGGTGDPRDPPDLLRARLRLRPPRRRSTLPHPHGEHGPDPDGQGPPPREQVRLPLHGTRARRHSPLRAPAAGREGPPNKARRGSPRRQARTARRQSLRKRRPPRRALPQARPLQAGPPEDLLLRPRNRPQRPLLHDGRQPDELARLPLLRTRPGGRRPRRSPRPLLAPGAGRCAV